METCAGCGSKAEKHPIVMIGREDQAGDVGPLVDVPICRACHEDPRHRTQPLKGHFFDRLDRERALDGAHRQVLLQDRRTIPAGLDPAHHEEFLKG